MAAAISPEDAVHSATRASGVQERKAEGGPSELMAVAPSRWSQQWQYLENKVLAPQLECHRLPAAERQCSTWKHGVGVLVCTWRGTENAQRRSMCCSVSCCVLYHVLYLPADGSLVTSPMQSLSAAPLRTCGPAQQGHMFSSALLPYADSCVLRQLGLHPLFRRVRALRDHKVLNRGREIAEDLQTRWEMSDSPLVQRMQVCATRLEMPACIPSSSHRFMELHGLRPLLQAPAFSVQQG